MRAMSPCVECARHVRPDETHCPFCGEAVAFVEFKAPRRWKNLGRAAILGFAAATLSACGGGDGNGGDDTVDDGTGGGEDGSGGDTGGDGSGDDGEDMGNPVPAYGVPADPEPGDGGDDGGDDGGGDSAVGPGPDDPGTVVAMYGVPAPDDE